MAKWRDPDADRNTGLGRDLPNRQHQRIGEYERTVAFLFLKWGLPPVVGWIAWWYVGHWFFHAPGLWFASLTTVLSTVVIYFIYWLQPENVEWLETDTRT